ncbi:MAG: hypothetical protein TECD_00362 [Hyphomicrobiaceae bacterium hypho_1]
MDLILVTVAVLLISYFHDFLAAIYFKHIKPYYESNLIHSDTLLRINSYCKLWIFSYLNSPFGETFKKVRDIKSLSAFCDSLNYQDKYFTN